MAIHKVLIVDDSLSSRLVLRRMLERQNVGAEMVASAKEAITFLVDNRPDAIFMDHEMPGMDGLQALGELKKNPATQAIPVAMFTTREETDYIKTALQQGAIGVLPKPFNEGALSSILQTLQASSKPDSAQQAAANDDDSVTAIEGAHFDPKTLEKVIHAIVNDVLQKETIQQVIYNQVASVIDQRLLTLKEEISANLEDSLIQQTSGNASEEQIKEVAIAALAPELEQTQQQLSDLIAQQTKPAAEETLERAKSLIAAAQQEHVTVLEDRFEALENKIAGHLDEVSQWLAAQKSKAYDDVSIAAAPVDDVQTPVIEVATGFEGTQKAEIIDIVPQEWDAEVQEIIYAKPKSRRTKKVERVYAFAGLTTIIIGIVITGLFLLSNLLQMYQDIEP